MSVTLLPGSFVVCLMVVCLGVGRIPGVYSHGRLMDPPSRSSMWRVEYDNPPNYDDNQLFCGGFSVQWERYGGKCGLCGDPWTGPRENEPGGKFANGVITRKYREGEVIDVYVQLTANHKGYFEFRLCQHNDPLTNITRDCLDRHQLIVDSTGRARHQIQSDMRDVRLKLRLPPGLTCTACVLQWKYNAGNSWGVDPETHQGCIGCGPQEQFYGCADVAIGHDEIATGVPPDRFPWRQSSTTKGTTPSAWRPHVSQPAAGGGGSAATGGQSQNVLSTTSPPRNPHSEWHYGIAYMFGSEGGGGGGGNKEKKTTTKPSGGGSSGVPLQSSAMSVGGGLVLLFLCLN